MIEHRLGRAEHVPEFIAEIGQAEQGHAFARQTLDDGVCAFDRPRHGFVEAHRIGADVGFILREQRDPFGQHVRERAPAIMLEMPFLGHDIGEEPVELVAVRDQLFEQGAKLPLEQHPPDIEHHRLAHAACSSNDFGPRSWQEAGRNFA